MKSIFFAIFCCINILSHCQTLLISDVTNMRGYSFSRVDSVMKVKEFEKTDDETETGFHIDKYSYYQKTDTAVNRYDFIFGEQPKYKRKTLRYVVWSKASAEGVITWLVVNGYKKKETKFPSFGNIRPDNMIQYIKSDIAITYLEEKNDDDKNDIKIRWAFEINTFNGK